MAFLIDLVGVILYGTFLGIWSILITEPIVPGHGEWSQMIVFTFIFCGMAFSGVAIHVVAFWYITFRFQWDDHGVRFLTLFRDTFQPWENIRELSLQPKVDGFAKWLRATALALSVFNWRMAGPALLMQTESVCHRLAIREGEGWRVDVGNLSPQGLAGLVHQLRERGIPVSAEMAKLCTAVGEVEHQHRNFLIYLVIAVLASLVVYALWRTMPPSLS